jgi:transposase
MNDTPRSNARPAAQGGRRPTEAAGRTRLDTGRWSSRRETEIVLRLLKGETLDALSRELQVSSARLAQCRDEALVAMQTGLHSREP